MNITDRWLKPLREEFEATGNLEFEHTLYYLDELISGMNSDEGVLRKLLVWHEALLPMGTLARIVGNFPEGVSTYPRAQLLKAIVACDLLTERDDADWRGMREQFERIETTDDVLLESYVAIYAHFIATLAPETGDPDELYGKALALAGRHPENMKHLLVSLLRYNEGTRLRVIDPDMGSIHYQDSLTLLYVWIERERGKLHNPRALRMQRLAALLARRWQDADRLFGKGSSAAWRISRLMPGFKEIYGLS